MQRFTSFIRLRWLVIIAISYLILLENGYIYGEVLDSIVPGAYLLALILSNIFLYTFKGEFFRGRHFYSLVALIDILAVTAGVAMFGRPSSDFYIAYFFIILLTIFGESLYEMLITTLVSITIYASYSFYIGTFGVDSAIKAFLIFGVGLFNWHVLNMIREEKTKRHQAEDSNLETKKSYEKEKNGLSEVLSAQDSIVFVLDKNKRLSWGTKRSESYSDIIEELPLKEKDSVYTAEKKINGRYFMVSTLSVGERLICAVRETTKIKEIESEAEFRRKSMVMLRECVEDISQGKGKKEVFLGISSHIKDIFSLEISMLLEPSGDNLIPIEVYGDDSLRNEVFPIMDSIMGIAVTTKSPAIIGDLELFSPAYGIQTKRLGLRSLACVPILNDGNVRYVFLTASKEPRPLEQTIINTITIAGSILSLHREAVPPS